MRTGNKAFSLAELLVGLVIGAIVVLMIGAMGTIATKSYKDLHDQSGLDSDAQFALDMIRYAVRQSEAVPSFSGTTLTIDTNHRFDFDGANLSYVTVSPASSLRVLSGLSSLSFTVSGSTLVTVGLSYRKAGVDHSYSVQVARRNP